MTEKTVRALVLAGDYAYIRQIETTLKSLCYHNSHLKVYILNQDIPTEWFRAMRVHLQEIGGDLVDCKLIGPQFQLNWSNKLPHINHMTFARYFIPDFVEEETVLYLDSDLLVTSELHSLFDIELGENYLAAVRSCFGAGLGFNAGVLLINNKLWKEENVRDLLLETTAREHENVNEGDQSIMNMLFKGRYLNLDDTYNFQIGFDRGAAEQGHAHLLQFSLDPLPKIIHYISPDKPWNQFSISRLREVWWRYNLLEWSDIIEVWKSKGIYYDTKPYQQGFTCFNLTNSYNVEQLAYLVQALPEVHFTVAAYTFMAGDLLVLSKYPNVTLYPNDFPLLIEKIVAQSDLYLDINHDEKLEVIYDYLSRYQIPSLTFDNTKHPEREYRGIYSNEHPEEMVVAIRQIMEEKKHA